jgi:hypothetical protein
MFGGFAEVEVTPVDNRSKPERTYAFALVERSYILIGKSFDRAMLLSGIGDCRRVGRNRGNG